MRNSLCLSGWRVGEGEDDYLYRGAGGASGNTGVFEEPSGNFL